jgi:integrase
MRSSDETPKSHANRCSDIRQFTTFLNLNGFEAHVPVMPKKVQSSFKPYIFTHDEMSRIFNAADSLKPHSRYNCAEVYPVLFRMLYGCGLRISEALNLRMRDVDSRAGVLTIKSSKFNKSRLVAMSPSLAEVCSKLSDTIHVFADDDDFFFKNRDGSRRSHKTVADRFRELLWASDIPYRGKGYGPRLHDVRHSFCCHTLRKMSDSGIDMYCSLPVLSTFIGHSSITATEQYIRLTEEFYPDIAQRTRTSFPSVYPEVYYGEAD